MQHSDSVMSLSSLLHSVWLLCPCIAVVCGSSSRWYLRWEDHTSSFHLHTHNIVFLDRLINLCNSWIREADTLHLQYMAISGHRSATSVVSFFPYIIIDLLILFHDLHFFFFLPFLAFPVLWSIFVHVKGLQSEKAQSPLPSELLLLHLLKHLVWSPAITSVFYVCHYVTGIIQVYILINLSLVVWWENTTHVGQDTSLSFIKCLYISCTVSSSSSWLQYSLDTTSRETTVMV